MQVSLSTGVLPAVATAAARLVTGEQLTDAEIAAVLGRLPDWDSGIAEPADFARPATTLQPPRTGETIDTPFPPTPDVPTPEVATGPLRVLRYQPDGAVDVAPWLSVTFSQAMVPLTTHAQLDEVDVPIQIEPAISGTWRWIGSSTARFEHDGADIDRLPMATDYTVTIPAGTESAAGNALARDVRFTFSTPAVQVRSVTPNGTQSLSTTPVFVASFDQRVEPDAALAAMRLVVGRDAAALRLATPAEIAADE